MLKRLLTCLIAAIIVSGAAQAEAPGGSAPVASLAITPFVSSMRGEDAWIGKAIADLLARKLATTSDYQLLERTRLQSFLDELELQESGIVGAEDARRLGNVAQVDQVIYGNFSRTGGELEINLILVELRTQSVLQRQSVDGDVETLQQAVTQLARSVLENRGRALNSADEAQLNYRSTDSTSALQRFYEAFDQLDHGQTEDAFGSFYAASERDRDFHEARLWMGLTLRQLAYDELAVIALQEAAQQAADNVEGRDAKLFLAELLEESDPSRAADVYAQLVEQQPASPHILEAAYRLSNLLERQGDKRGAYDALATINEYAKAATEQSAQWTTDRSRERSASAATAADIWRFARQFVGLVSDEKEAARPGFVFIDNQGLRHSQFFTWRRALGLNREAIVRMAMLYPELLSEEGDADGAPPPPRGTFLVTPKNPTVTEAEYGQTESLFLETGDVGTVWNERLYAVVAPKGWVITGAELNLTGRLLVASRDHSFGMRLFPMPMPANYHNAWIAALYGQTETVSTLEKYAPFHGETYTHLLVQLAEYQSELHGWELSLSLQPADAVPASFERETSKASVHGETVVGRVRHDDRAYYGPSQPQHLYMRKPRRSLAIADNGLRGLTLVSARGDLGNEQTDLWVSQSDRGESWTKPTPLPINSVGEDYAPQLLRTEDGGLRLFWLSNRRGRGWELWTSKSPSGKTSEWSKAARVPLDQFIPSVRSDPAIEFSESPIFAVVQDKRGRWILTVHRRVDRRIVNLVSRDGVEWRRAGPDIETPPLVGIAVAESKDRAFTILSVNEAGNLTHWRSNNLRNWVRRDAPPEKLFRPRYGFNYSTYLFPGESGQFIAFLSDSIYGLQFARFDHVRQDPIRDLVPRVTLEAFATTPAQNGGYFIATENSNGVDIRHYQLAGGAKRPSQPLATPLYTERGRDAHGNEWSRTFAGARVIQPDVTAVAAQSDERVWWGIETGVFAATKDAILFSNGAMGYPFHTTTEIQPCGGNIFFASQYSRRPRVAIGVVSSVPGMDLLRTDELPLESAGRVTDLACGADESLIVGTSVGEIFVLEGDRSQITRYPLGGNGGVSTLVVDPKDRSVLIGTDHGETYRMTTDVAPLPPLPVSGQSVQALAVDSSGNLWAAVEELGLFQFAESDWRGVSVDLPHMSRFSVTALEADSFGGLWILPHSEIASAGLMRLANGEVTLFNPPHGRLATPIDMTVAADGTVLIGTGSDGLYQLEVKH